MARATQLAHARFLNIRAFRAISSWAKKSIQGVGKVSSRKHSAIILQDRKMNMNPSKKEHTRVRRGAGENETRAPFYQSQNGRSCPAAFTVMVRNTMVWSTGAAMHEHWIADRMRGIEVSGIRKIFDLAAKLKGTINSIGQADLPVPEPIN
jgi:hypothetical protein